MDVSLVIPTLNEEENLQILFSRIPKFVKEIIVVDGYSKDNTVKVAESYGAKVIYNREEKGGALRAGITEATHDIVVTMDADCSHLPEELPEFIQGIEAGNDVVFGSRFLRGGGSDDITYFRAFGNAIFRTLINFLWKTDYTDVCYGYMAFRKQAFSRLNLRATGFDIEVELKIQAAKQKLKTLQVPSYEKKRAFGLGKLESIRDGWIILRRIFQELFS